MLIIDIYLPKWLKYVNYYVLYLRALYFGRNTSVTSYNNNILRPECIFICTYNTPVQVLREINVYMIMKFYILNIGYTYYGADTLFHCNDS